jgi:serine/threonine protein phosphatase PrpC
MGSSAHIIDGCSAVDELMGACTNYDPDRSPCSPLYAPPEQFASPDTAASFDVFCVSICVLRLAWSRLASDEGLQAFRQELTASTDGELESWIRGAISGVAMSPALASDLSVDFYRPSRDDDSRSDDIAPQMYAMLAAMLRADPARRPSVSALLAHPLLCARDPPTHPADPTSPAVADAPADGSAPDGSAPGLRSPPAWLSEILDKESCAVLAHDTAERPLSVRVRLKPPFGLVLGELDDEIAPDRGGSSGGVVVDGILPGASAAACDQIRAGDRLVAVDGKAVRDAPFEDVMALLSARRRSAVALDFERRCDADECDVSGTVLDGADAPADMTVSGEAAAGGNGRMWVLDAGVSEDLGARRVQEDTHVLTSFTTSPAVGPPSRCVLAAVFDGHRGGAASAHAAEHLPGAVRSALARGEPSPLAAAWRAVCDSYAARMLQDGCTATAALLTDDGRCEIVNVGDSRTVVVAEDGRGDGQEPSDRASDCCAPDSIVPSVAFATRDHSPDDLRESERIAAGGGTLACGVGGSMRVTVESPEGNWQVAVARALGGTEWRSGGIINTADVQTIQLEPRHRYILLASDGIWGALDSASTEAGWTNSLARSERVAFAASAAFRAGGSAGSVAEGLTRLAASEGGTDNACCIALRLGMTAAL